jgi:hypothetical protein
MRRAGHLAPIGPAALVFVTTCLLGCTGDEEREPAPRDVPVAIEPHLTADDAWHVGRNPPGKQVDREVSVEAETLEDGRLHVVRRLPKPDFEDVTEFWLDFEGDAPKARARAFTLQLGGDLAWHVQDLEGIVRVRSSHPLADASPLVFEYELWGWQSGSDHELRGKIALDPPATRK